MKISYISDLHLDIGGTEKYREVDFSMFNDSDVIIVAGDVHNDAVYSAQFLADLASKTGKKVLFVPGNHEYYLRPIEVCDKMFEDHMVHILSKYKEPIIIDDVLFIGDTLWTDFDLYGPEEREYQMYSAATRMNDYHRIWLDFIGGEKLTPNLTREYCKEAVQCFEAKIKRVKDRCEIRKVVVVTHHGPSFGSIDDAYKVPQYSNLSGAYASGILDKENASYSKYLSYSVDLWIHGHTHSSLDYEVCNVRVVTNPRGYTMRDGDNENPDFVWYKTVDI